MKKRMMRLMSAALALTLALWAGAPAMASAEPAVRWLPDTFDSAVWGEDLAVRYVEELGVLVVEGYDASSFTPHYKMYDPATGLEITDRPYVMAEEFSDGLAVAATAGGMEGYLDVTGNFAIEPTFYDAASFYGGFAKVISGTVNGFINTRGEKTLDLSSGFLGGFDGGSIIINSVVDGVMVYGGVMDSAGNILAEPRYTGASPFREGMARVSETAGTGDARVTKYGYVDTSGKLAVPAVYDNAAPEFHEGLAYVLVDGKYGYIDKTGELVIPAVYDEAHDFSEGLAAVSSGEAGFGFIDRSGQTVIAPGFDGAGNFKNGLAPVEENEYVNGEWTGKRGLIDSTGELAVPYTDEYLLEDWEAGLVVIASLAGNGRTYGLMDYSGALVLPAEYDSVTLDGEYFFVQKGEEVGFAVNPGFTPGTYIRDIDDVSPEDYWYAPVAWSLAEGIAEPIGAGVFSPRSGCTRADVVLMLWRAAGSPDPGLVENPFTDLSEDDSCYSAVLWACGEGIARGYPDGRFVPEGTVTRGEAVTFIHRAEGEPVPAGDARFTDVPDGEFFAAPVLWALERGVTTGVTDTLFFPRSTVTRGEMVTFIYRWLRGNG